MALPNFYSMAMSAMILRMLVLASLMLMPFSMAAAPAAPVQQHPTAVQMPMGHCPDRDQKSHSGGALATCAMACSAALPAFAPAAGPSVLVEREAAAQSLAPTLTGIELDIATPPPRLS